MPLPAGKRFFDQYSVICVFGSVVGCVVVPLLTQVSLPYRTRPFLFSYVLWTDLFLRQGLVNLIVCYSP